MIIDYRDMHAYIMYGQTCMHTDRQTCMHTYWYIHTGTCMQTDIHTISYNIYLNCIPRYPKCVYIYIYIYTYLSIICCDTPNISQPSIPKLQHNHWEIHVALAGQEVCGRPFSGQEAILMAKGEMDPRTRQPKRLEALTNAERRAIDILLADKRSEQSDYRHQVALEDWICFILDSLICDIRTNVEKTSMHHCITVRLVF